MAANTRPLPDAAATTGSTPRLQGMDGLRAIAALGVFGYHVWLYAGPDGSRVDLGTAGRVVLPHLALGLTLFFTLSGFLLYRPFARAVLTSSPSPWWRSYTRNRLLRIMPAYVVILLLATVLLPAGLVRSASGELVLGSLRDEPELLLRNLLLVQSFFPDSVVTGIGPAWSLTVELVFYAVLPLVSAIGLWVVARSPRPGRAAPLAVLVAPAVFLVVGLATKLALATVIVPEVGYAPGWDADRYSVVQRSFLAQADLFAFGMVAAIARVQHERCALRLTRRAWGSLGLASLAVIAAICVLRTVGMVPTAAYQTIAAVGCAGIVAFVALADADAGRVWRPLVLLEARPVVAVGLVSYSFYLWHEPLIRLLADNGLTAAGPGKLALVLLIDLAVVLVLATLTYRLVEVPALRRKRTSASVASV
jgi:peptidoglycan/LPS O-acetylase OafA/YrhL